MFKVVNKVGKAGEDTACVFLMKQGYSIVDRNYWKKWGEIDIVANKSGTTHFIEVKSVSRSNLGDVSHETDGFRPEDNLHPWKLERLKRVIQSYLAEKRMENRGNWQFDAICVYLNHQTKQAKVSHLENIIL